MIRKDKKTRSKRGKENHSGLRRRGSGNRGGVGNAGHGKKAREQKKTQMIVMGLKLGKHGFTNPTSKKNKSINISDLMKHAKNNSVNAIELGYDKVISKGKPLSNITVTAHSFSEKAKEKIEKSKGKAVVM